MDWPLDHNRPQLAIISNEASFIHAAKLAPTEDSAAWGAANVAVFTPIFVPQRMTARYLYVWNGATASGNIDLGIFAYTTDDPTAGARPRPGTRIVSTGSTAQAGTSQFQEVAISAKVLAPGWYYLGMAMDNGTGTVTRFATPTAWDHELAGIHEGFSSFPLPADPSTNPFGQNSAPVLALGGIP